MHIYHILKAMKYSHTLGETRGETKTHVLKKGKIDSKEEAAMQEDYYHTHITAKHAKHHEGGGLNVKSTAVISAEPHMQVTVTGKKSIKGTLESFEIVGKTSTQI